MNAPRQDWAMHVNPLPHSSYSRRGWDRDTGGRVQFHVAQLLKEHTGATRRFSMDEEIRHLNSEDLTIEAPLKGEVVLMKDTEGVLVTGHLATEVAVPCVRCLEPVVVPVEFDLEEQFYPTIDIETGRRLTTPEDADSDTFISNRHILDITELVRQSLLLAVPMQPIHDYDCAPPTVDTTDEDQTIDPRWEALSSLRNGNPE